jgi:hypothetical protein
MKARQREKILKGIVRVTLEEFPDFMLDGQKEFVGKRDDDKYRCWDFIFGSKRKRLVAYPGHEILRLELWVENRAPNFVSSEAREEGDEWEEAIKLHWPKLIIGRRYVNLNVQTFDQLASRIFSTE